MVIYALYYHIQCNGVSAALGHDNIGVFAAGLYILFMHRLNGCKVLVYYRLKGSAPFTDITADTAQYTNVGIGIDENFNIHKVADTLILKYKYAFYDNYFIGLYYCGFIRAVMHRIVVNGTFYGIASFKLLKVLYKKVVIKGVGMVVV